jgi:hypothetical protein
MRRYRKLTVSREIQAALANHLGADFHCEKPPAHRSRAVRYVFFPLALAALAAVLLAIFRYSTR